MQNYNLVPPSEIRDKLKKRILSSSPVMGGEPTTQKITKKSKKEAESEVSKEDEKKPEKHVYKPDPLTTILNEKKASLVRDPEVIAFLKKFNQELHRGRVQK